MPNAKQHQLFIPKKISMVVKYGMPKVMSPELFKF